MIEEQAVKIVAADALSRLDLSRVLDWEDVPELCRSDFERVFAKAETTLAMMRPNKQLVKRAMAVLKMNVEEGQ